MRNKIQIYSNFKIVCLNFCEVYATPVMHCYFFAIVNFSFFNTSFTIRICLSAHIQDSRILFNKTLLYSSEKKSILTQQKFQTTVIFQYSSPQYPKDRLIV